MKKLISLSLLTSAFILSAAAFAETAPVQKVTAPTKPIIQKTENKSDNKVAQKTVVTTVNLYESPNDKAKIIAKIPADADLVAIYHQGDWIKVGDRQNGDTGWINVQQYHQARHDFYHHYFHTNINSIYFNWTKGKDGKTVIEAYRNGKKLSEAEAKKLYAQVHQQEEHQWQAMEKFNQVMDEQMQADYLNARRALDNAFSSPAIVEPSVVVIENPTPAVQQTTSAEKSKK